MTSNDPIQMTAVELLSLYRSRHLSPVDVTQAVLRRIEMLQPYFNAFRAVDAEAALTQARASERRWQRNAPAGVLDASPFNLTQQPAASIPAGFDRNGLPVGLQIVGAQYADALVLRAARAFEHVHPIALPNLASLRAA
jgi:Asp-tRNA(Asn)/Glu-tRNA(Gln) amidotransferase A subunit family amidase